jgi:hypothetical protein
MKELSGAFAPFSWLSRRNMTNNSYYCVKEFMAFSGGPGIILAEAGRELNDNSLAHVGCRWGWWAVLSG